MLVRIRCRDKPRGGEQIIEGKGVNSSSARNSKARNTDRELKLRILSKSVYLLLGPYL